MDADVIDAEQRKNKGWANLIPAKPGECRNPNGRPKGSDLTSVIRRALEEAGKRGETHGERLVKLAMYHAAKGDFRYFKEIIDRMNGPTLTQAAGNITNVLVLNVPPPRALEAAESPPSP